MSSTRLTGKAKVAAAAIFIGSLFIPVPALVRQREAGDVQQAGQTLLWVDRSGSAQPLGAPRRAYGLPRLSPDGRRVAVEIKGAKYDIWVYDLAADSLTQLTFEAVNRFPLWTPDGRRIAFGSSKPGPVNVFWRLVDGGGEERLTTGEHNHGPQSFSPDGKILSFYEIHPATGRDIWMLALEEERKPWPFPRTAFLEGGAVFSPDGRWLAYVSNDSGRFEIYVQPFPGPGERRQISTEGGAEPIWPRNSRELFYRNGDKMMAVEIRPQATLAAGKPKPLFQGKYQNSPGSRANYDVTPDGQRFLMIR